MAEIGLFIRHESVNSFAILVVVVSMAMQQHRWFRIQQLRQLVQ